MGILDNAKEIASAVHEIRNLDLYARVLDLHSGIIDLVEENRKLRDEVENLKRKLHIKSQMTFKRPLYFQDGDATPFCPLCWEKDDTAIHVVLEWKESGQARWDCPSCKGTYIVGRG